MQRTLHVLAFFQARPDAREQLIELLHGLVAPTQAEDGCIRYELVEQLEDPCSLVFVEEWRDEAALDAHSRSAHLSAARPKFDALIEEPVQVHRYWSTH